MGSPRAQRFAVVLVPVLVALMTATSAAGAATASKTGWVPPYSGTPAYEQFAPPQVMRVHQLNAPLGRARADQLAASLGFDKAHSMSHEQFAKFLSGGGEGGGNAAGRKAAELTDTCARYLTNTTASAMYREINGTRTRVVLASYGLIVNEDGMLESPANSTSPCRQINWVLAPKVVCRFPESDPPPGVPCGYMGKWLRKNGARDTLVELYTSAYSGEAMYGAQAQDASGAAQLVVNRKPGDRVSTVGMSMIPSIWIVNFLLVYALSPNLAAKMPAYWTPIPPAIADAITASPTGQVPYADYQQYFTS